MANASTVTDYLGALEEPLREIGTKAQEIIDAALPEAPGALWHGHPVWSLGGAPGRTPVCLLKAYGSYVTFGLWQGQGVTDPSGRLEAGAREMASVKLRALDDVDAALFTDWLLQARALAAESA
jgi:hypothetical protein